MTSEEHYDVVIVGAGLSGIGAAVHLKKNCPDRSFTILEGRSNPGGTWDLFRYPGVRSDSARFVCNSGRLDVDAGRFVVGAGVAIDGPYSRYGAAPRTHLHWPDLLRRRRCDDVNS